MAKRKRVRDKAHCVAFWLSPEEKARLDELAVQTGGNASAVMRQLLGGARIVVVSGVPAFSGEKNVDGAMVYEARAAHTV